MAKELEALERLYCEGDLEQHKKDYKLLKQALLELQAIKEAKPSEALDFLKQQAIAFEHSELAIKVANENYTTIKQALLKAEKVKKVLKVIEVVTEKDVDLRDLKAYFKVERGLQEYNKHQYKENELTQQEFDLLKEVVENE